MANWFEPTPEHHEAWKEFLASLPEATRAVAVNFPPWELFRLKNTPQRVMLMSINDDLTLTMVVSGKFNRVIHERSVFGIKPDDLEPCDLPGPDEEVGALMTQEQAGDNIDALRCMIRPDLWVMGDDGIAVRRH